MYTILVWMNFFSLAAMCQVKDTTAPTYLDSLEARYQYLHSTAKALKGFLPSVSPAMIEFGQKEVNLFNNLITSNQFRGSDHALYDANSRSTYNYTIFQFTQGVSRTNRFNIGMDLNSVLGLIDENRKGSPLAVFSNSSSGNSYSAKSITTIGVHTRWQPLKKNSQFILQSSFLIPTLNNVKKETALGKSQWLLINTLLYGIPFSHRLYFLPQVTFEYGFRKLDAPALFILPLSTYLSFLLSNKVFLFTVANGVPVFVKDQSWQLNSYTIQLGGGVQYQPSKRFLLNAFLTHDIYGKAYFHSLGINLGTRILFN